MSNSDNFINKMNLAKIMVVKYMQKLKNIKKYTVLK